MGTFVNHGFFVAVLSDLRGSEVEVVNMFQAAKNTFKFASIRQVGRNMGQRMIWHTVCLNDESSMHMQPPAHSGELNHHCPG